MTQTRKITGVRPLQPGDQDKCQTCRTAPALFVIESKIIEHGSEPGTVWFYKQNLATCETCFDEAEFFETPEDF